MLSAMHATGLFGFQFFQTSTPTTHAAMSEEIAPPTIASNPMRERSWRRLGASDEIPPTWMPTEAKFAKPHKAYVASSAARGERYCGLAVSLSFMSEYAISS